ncbi:hydroxyacylglutathione hydrolase [Zophobihabitans entericus]|uniref:Hydroxyacylglutathione hydrolase n=1 Tax=Zophobihabitans entericus TaxID=1635327 RepID=A0A6G9IC47_9GAMM|nr:hydroxyacylglutathione hydrolase [Zophobihabitans entericus]QIQ21806.1 hydroxyacylglutathione hydrolase [Zophobihabitans entericus]
MYQLTTIPALETNYIWLLTNDKQQTVIVDPSTAKPVIDYLSRHSLKPVAILLTHHHDDHTAGVAELVKAYPEILVFGSATIQQKLQLPVHTVHESDKVQLENFDFQVIETPGHTLDHVVYYQAPYLFCGDTLFAGGCGRIFEGTHEQMFNSLKKLYQLPNQTLICCAHEYTLDNFKFALSVLPDDIDLLAQFEKIKELRKDNKITLPTTLELEKRTNLFLRWDDERIQQKLQITDSEQVFSKLRTMKDRF